VITQTIWKATAKLSDKREIVYFDESSNSGRATVAGTRGLPELDAHLRVFSVRRAADKLKYLAGTESGMGVWINDIVPEEAARRLREITEAV
jgi:galactose-1-phosphate uridylyltransferase